MTWLYRKSNCLLDFKIRNRIQIMKDSKNGDSDNRGGSTVCGRERHTETENRLTYHALAHKITIEFIAL